MVSEIELLVLLIKSDLIQPDLSIDLLYLALSLLDQLEFILDLLSFLLIEPLLHFSLVLSVESFLMQLGISLCLMIVFLHGESTLISMDDLAEVLWALIRGH